MVKTNEIVQLKVGWSVHYDCESEIARHPSSGLLCNESKSYILTNSCDKTSFAWLRESRESIIWFDFIILIFLAIDCSVRNSTNLKCF